MSSVKRLQKKEKKRKGKKETIRELKSDNKNYALGEEEIQMEK